MAANWHLGDVGSTTDFSINARLGHPGAPYSPAARAGGACSARGVPCPAGGRAARVPRSGERGQGYRRGLVLFWLLFCFQAKYDD